MINTDFRPAVLPTVISGNIAGVVSPRTQENELFYADRERVWEVQSLVQGIIRDARSHQGFINSLGMFRGENSNENKKLKIIIDRKRLHITPINLMDLVIKNMALEATEVVFLINKGFIQIIKSVPENIQKDMLRLNLAVADLTKSL